jgi:hypothetical protein
MISKARTEGARRLALFLTAAQVHWLNVGLGSLPRATRDPIRRELDRQLAAHDQEVDDLLMASGSSPASEGELATVPELLRIELEMGQ